MIGSFGLLAFAMGCTGASMDSMENGQDLATWKKTGTVVAEKNGAKFGEDGCEISCRIKASSLHVTAVDAAAKVAKGTRVSLIARCLNSRGKIVYQVSSTSAADKDSSNLGLYFKTHVDTRTLEIAIVKSGSGEASVSGVAVRDDDAERIVHEPKIDLNQYTLPVWEGPVAYDESVLFVGEPTQPLRATLLFQPGKILSVTDSGKSIVFEEGKDYKIEGKEIVRLPGSRMLCAEPSIFPKGDLPWHQVFGKHVLVTYEHADSYAGPKPENATDLLIETFRKLIEKKPVKIVALGDSITLGTGTTGFWMNPPYVPTWPQMLVHRWQTVFANKAIKMVNLSLGGQTTYWAKEIAPSCAAPLKPDLTIIAFGMNDFWSISPDIFKSNIEAIIASIRKANAKAEFVLISSVPFDSAYSSDKYYLGNLNGYPAVLSSLKSKGIAYVDMHEIGQYLDSAKGHKSLTGDPMHPIDYFARWYSSAVSSLLDKPKGSR